LVVVVGCFPLFCVDHYGGIAVFLGICSSDVLFFKLLFWDFSFS
jgi:hypothetical protein